MSMRKAFSVAAAMAVANEFDNANGLLLRAVQSAGEQGEQKQVKIDQLEAAREAKDLSPETEYFVDAKKFDKVPVESEEGVEELSRPPANATPSHPASPLKMQDVYLRYKMFYLRYKMFKIQGGLQNAKVLVPYNPMFGNSNSNPMFGNSNPMFGNQGSFSTSTECTKKQDAVENERIENLRRRRRSGCTKNRAAVCVLAVICSLLIAVAVLFGGDAYYAYNGGYNHGFIDSPNVTSTGAHPSAPFPTEAAAHPSAPVPTEAAAYEASDCYKSAYGEGCDTDPEACSAFDDQKDITAKVKVFAPFIPKLRSYTPFVKGTNRLYRGVAESRQLRKTVGVNFGWVEMAIKTVGGVSIGSDGMANDGSGDDVLAKLKAAGDDDDVQASIIFHSVPIMTGHNLANLYKKWGRGTQNGCACTEPLAKYNTRVGIAFPSKWTNAEYHWGNQCGATPALCGPGKQMFSRMGENADECRCGLTRADANHPLKWALADNQCEKVAIALANNQ